jgi:hypothetical protein
MAQWFYRQLVKLYPAVYRRDYGEPMEQAFRDQLRDAGTVPQRVWLLTSVTADAVHSAVKLHSDLETGTVGMGALFISMCLLIAGAACATEGNRWAVGSVMGACAFLMGYLDPIRERSLINWTFLQGARRWTFRLSIVGLIAVGIWGNSKGYSGMIVFGYVTARLGASLRCRLSPEFDGIDFDDPPPALISLNLK